MAGRSLFSGDGVQSSRSMRPTNRSRRLPEAAARRRPEMAQIALVETPLLGLLCYPPKVPSALDPA